MKAYKTLRKVASLFIVGMVIFTSCQKDAEQALTEVGEGQVGFAFSVPADLKDSDCDLKNAISAVITVKTDAGEQTDYYLTPITVYKLNDRIFTQKIALTTGSYKLTEFYLIDISGNVLFTIPLNGSPLASQIVNPLPMSFGVETDKSHDYPVEVICVDGFEPEDFGLTWFGIEEVEVCHFLISVSELGSNTILDADVTVSNGDYTYNQAISKDVVPNKVFVKCGLDYYNVEVYVPGYESFSIQLSPADMQKYYSEPLVVELLPLACGEAFITNLVLQDMTKVGEVTASRVGDKLQVKYHMTASNWYIEKTNLSVTSTLSDVPKTVSGEPNADAFALVTDHDPIVKSYSYLLTPPADKNVILAAATVSKYDEDLDMIEEMLPLDKVTVQVKFTGHPSYFQTTVTGSGVIDGTYPGNCVDLDHGIYTGRNYSMNLVSSYTDDAELLDLLVDKPQNLDLVNYVINQDYSTLGASGREIQASIWTLIDDIAPQSGTGGIKWNQQIVNAIIADAQNYGEGFTPHCGQKALVIADPGVKQDPSLISQVTLVQITTIAIDNVCTPVVSNSQAWAKGKVMENSAWAMYFNYCFK